MLPLFNKEALQRACRREDLIRETADQIIKDFSEFGLDVVFSGEVVDFYQDLFFQLKVHVTQLVERNYTRFLSLLYRIDISDNEIVAYEKEYPDLSYSEVLSILIIHRELKKVLTRDFFRSKK
ncbi:hypothetical protein DMA11_03670 [Marinilabiliaceae bacterium JC017]|nr:hypothetical protein DMA11_03670 [Marinilabiliaceae bacterium JC017]